MDLEIAAEQPGLKTLHLTNCWHATSGGIGTFYKALFETANREGHAMRLVVPGESTSVQEVGRCGRIYQIESRRAPLNPDYRMVLPHRYLFPRTALQRIVNSEQPDLLEVSDKYAMHYMAGLLRTGRLPGVRRRPTVVGMSHERMDENVSAYVTSGRAGRLFCRWYMKWLYFPMFDHHITVSEHTAQELINASHGHKVRRGIWIAPMGVDVERFTPRRRSAETRRHLCSLAGADEGVTLLFYAGRLAPEKNLQLLVATMALLDPKKYCMVIAGAGMMNEPLQRECVARGLGHVAFAGHVGDRETLANYFASADMFVHPNPREPFGIAPLEAMSSGVPLVAPDAGGVTSYANATNAWLAHATPETLAETIATANANPEARHSKSRAARIIAEEHSWPKVTSRHLQLYRELHALTQGQEITQTMAARSYSTYGDLQGRELFDL